MADGGLCGSGASQTLSVQNGSVRGGNGVSVSGQVNPSGSVSLSLHKERRFRLGIRPAVGFIRLGLLVRGVARLLRSLDCPLCLTPTAPTYRARTSCMGAKLEARLTLPVMANAPGPPPTRLVTSTAQIEKRACHGIGSSSQAARSLSAAWMPVTVKSAIAKSRHLRLQDTASRGGRTSS
jgi:hypothetical protein